MFVIKNLLQALQLWRQIPAFSRKIWNARLAEMVRDWLNQVDTGAGYGVRVNTTIRWITASSLQGSHGLGTDAQIQGLRLALAIEHLPHGLACFDNYHRLATCNTTFFSMYGIDPSQVSVGASIENVLRGCKFSPEFHSELTAVVSRMQPWATQIRLPDDRYMSVRLNPLPDGGVLMTHIDVTERYRLEDKIRHLASHDALTGLINRYGLQAVMKDAIARMGRGEGFAVLCIDLDNFKHVNDSLGHQVGDRLLQEVAARLKATVRETDSISRFGGDEFTIVQHAKDQPHSACALAERIIAALSAPYSIDDHQLIIGASVGVALAPSDGRDTETLLRNADLALYRSKSDGRGVQRLFEPEMDAKMQTRRQLELDLRQAIALQQFELYYQPLINADSEKIIGFEALIRWRHPERGLVPPMDFIPLAEEIGIMNTIGAWVLKTACCEAMGWPNDLRLAVNVSATQFRDRPLELDVAAALGASGLDPNRLEIEMTESVLLENSAVALTTLNKLRSLGIRIALDDFGTGYSSLTYLQKFPFDKIKIDKSFVQGGSVMGSHSVAIVKAVIDLSHNLGMTTTAEGVETSEQLGRLRLQGCKEVQGYLFSRPIPAKSIPGLLKTGCASLLLAS